jgi:hypothetical protein
MGWREFVASLVDSLAWPAAVAVVAWLFRRQLGALIEGPVKRWKAGPVEVEYWETAVEVAEAVVTAEWPSGSELDAELQDAARLAEWVPTVAVAKAFGVVGERLRLFAEAHGDEGAGSVSALELARSLEQQGLVNAQTLQAVEGLWALRRIAMHDDGSGLSISVKQAREFVTLAQGVVYGLDRSPRPGG